MRQKKYLSIFELPKYLTGKLRTSSDQQPSREGISAIHEEQLSLPVESAEWFKYDQLSEPIPLTNREAAGSLPTALPHSPVKKCFFVVNPTYLEEVPELARSARAQLRHSKQKG